MANSLIGGEHHEVDKERKLLSSEYRHTLKQQIFIDGLVSSFSLRLKQYLPTSKQSGKQFFFKINRASFTARTYIRGWRRTDGKKRFIHTTVIFGPRIDKEKYSREPETDKQRCAPYFCPAVYSACLFPRAEYNAQIILLHVT